MKIVRIKYEPYNFDFAKKIWLSILYKFLDKIEIEEQLREVWSNLIKYCHADDSCNFDINKAILLQGQTGSGKTVTINTLKNYMLIDNIRYYRNNKQIPFYFAIHTAKDIFRSYMIEGYAGLEKYIRIGNLCIDDLGAESKEGNYFGTKINVISEIIETRYNRNLLTHFTTNYNEKLILENYGRRVLSRMQETCNFIKLNDKDFRNK